MIPRFHITYSATSSPGLSSSSLRTWLSWFLHQNLWVCFLFFLNTTLPLLWTHVCFLSLHVLYLLMLSLINLSPSLLSFLFLILHFCFRLPQALPPKNYIHTITWESTNYTTQTKNIYTKYAYFVYCANWHTEIFPVSCRIRINESWHLWVEKK